MLRIVCWKWQPHNYYRTHFNAQAVNVFYNMISRHLHIPHEVVCITDDPTGIDPRVRIVPLWETDPRMKALGGITKPNCYTRLRAFSPEMKDIIGERFCWFDLDCVILKDITPLFDGKEDFRMMASTNPANFYNGSMVLMNAGARAQVWDDFDPATSAQIAAEAGYVGSDQAWISHRLGNGEWLFTGSDGVYPYRYLLNNMNDNDMPNNARIIFFAGKFNPWDKHRQDKHPWLRDNYF